jgi:hypothetical protein
VPSMSRSDAVGVIQLPCMRHSSSQADSQSGGGVMRMTRSWGMPTDRRYRTMLFKFETYSARGMCCLGFSAVKDTNTSAQMCFCYSDND